MKKYLIIVLLLLIVTIGLRVAVGYLSAKQKNPGLNTESDNRTLPDCPDKPNCVASFASREAQKTDPLETQGNAQQTLETLEDIIESMSGSKIVQRDENFIHATFTSRVLGFVDDVYILHQPDQSIIEVKSQSRLGYSDLGANRKRVNEIRLRLGQP